MATLPALLFLASMVGTGITLCVSVKYLGHSMTTQITVLVLCFAVPLLGGLLIGAVMRGR